MTGKSQARQAMEVALRSIFVAELRKLGWKGSLPHLRRIGAERADFLMLQQSRAGGSFVIEIVACGPTGLAEGPFKDVPVEKLKVSHFSPFQRLRLGADPENGVNDNWYIYQDGRGSGPKGTADPAAIANRVLADFHRQAEAHLPGLSVPAPLHPPRRMDGSPAA